MKLKSKNYIVYVLKVLYMLGVSIIPLILAIPYLVLTRETQVIKEYFKDIMAIRYSYFKRHYKDTK